MSISRFMKSHALITSTFLLALIVPANAQGIPGGVVHGAYEGNRIAGPVGWVVGGAVGGAIGGVEGLLGINHEYRAYYDVPPRSYRHRRFVRTKVRHSHRTHRR